MSNLCPNLPVAIQYLSRGYKTTRYFDWKFNDYVKVSYNDGIILTIPRYKLTVSAREALGETYECFYDDFVKTHKYNKVFNYCRALCDMTSRGHLKRVGSYKINLKDYDLKFNYYKKSEGIYAHEEDKVYNRVLNEVSEDEIRGKNGFDHLSSFSEGIAFAFYDVKNSVAEEMGKKKGTFTNIIDSIYDVFVPIFEQREKENEERRKNLKSYDPDYHHNSLYRYRKVYRDEWGNEM